MNLPPLVARVLTHSLTAVGLIIGFIFGATNIIRFGPGPNGIMRTLGQYMMGSAATFGFFMSIGTTIRTDSEREAIEAFKRARRRPVVMPLQYRRCQGAEEPGR